MWSAVPIGATVEEIREIAELVARTRLTYMTGETSYYYPNVLKDWKKVAGFPPMYYCTHSVSMVLSVTGARMTQVSCLGFKDREEGGIFAVGGNLWDNPFSNCSGGWAGGGASGRCRPEHHQRGHQFLIDDFLKAAVTGQLAPVNAWEAAKYTVPGLIAHESCKQGGITMEIPDLGAPPTNWEPLNPYALQLS